MVSRVPDTSRSRRMAQSDGLVRLTILSADGHPKGARSHELSCSQQLPTAWLFCSILYSMCYNAI